MALKVLTDGNELRSAIKTILHLERKISIVRIMTMGFGDFELSESICERLIRINRKGETTVTLVVEKEWWHRTNECNKNLLKDLDKRNIGVYVCPRLHAKLVLAIGEKEDDRGALLTSANFTHTGIHISREIGILFNGRGYDDVHTTLREFTNRILKSKATKPLKKFIEESRHRGGESS